MITNSGQATNFADRLTAFGSIVQGANLFVLREVDKQVDSLQAHEELSRAIAKMAALLTNEIPKLKLTPGQHIDRDDVFTDGMTAAVSALEDLLPKVVVTAAHLIDDPKLEQSRELLQVACDRYISSLADVIESCKNLIAAVISFGLRAESRPTQIFDSVDDLISDLCTSR